MLFGYDVVYGLMKFTVTCIPLLMAGVMSIFFMKFKPTRRFIDRLFNL